MKAVEVIKPGKDASASGSGTPSSFSLDGRTPAKVTGQKRKLRRMKRQTRERLEQLAIQSLSGQADSDNRPQASEPAEPSNRKRSLGSTPGMSGKPPQKI